MIENDLLRSWEIINIRILMIKSDEAINHRTPLSGFALQKLEGAMKYIEKRMDEYLITDMTNITE